MHEELIQEFLQGPHIRGSYLGSFHHGSPLLPPGLLGRQAVLGLESLGASQGVALCVSGGLKRPRSMQAALQQQQPGVGHGCACVSALHRVPVPPQAGFGPLHRVFSHSMLPPAPREAFVSMGDQDTTFYSYK
jgi:hypothetical protein